MKSMPSNADDVPWPLTVARSRYQGIYEGGRWVAWNCEPHDVNPDWSDDDVTCARYWGSAEANLAGRGSTPDEAILDLMRRLVLRA